MKLLVDENLPPWLVQDLADLFPDSVHVNTVGFGSTPDELIWEYARTQGFNFLTLDKDFASLSLTRGASQGDLAANSQLLHGWGPVYCLKKRDSPGGLRW